jgi:hypothetical protein
VARRSETATRSAVSAIRPAETLTRLATLGPLSRSAGEGQPSRSRWWVRACFRDAYTLSMPNAQRRAI